jgi:Asp-tRNA(Asn)/Glu-tRNA(Gln) amidotransferase A subunit family amidase
MSNYDLKSLSLPKLYGFGLQLFAAAMDHAFTRAALLPSLLRQGGVDRLRAMRLREDPTLYPYAPVDKRASRPLSPAEVEATLSTYAPQPPFASIREYANAYRSGATTPVEVAERILAAIQTSDASSRPLRAFIASDREDVLSQASAAAERLRLGNPLSILDGVPVAVKDEVDQAPYASHVGTSFLGPKPAQDCTPVARLRAAGALLVGKANMNELGLDPSGFNAVYGTTRNPFDLDRDPGGSSCGPAAAVAAGFCPAAIGCDGGGSIRIPASLCGVVGLKPTFGRISESGAASLCPSVDVIGPLGATVEDVALVYGIIAGPDPRDPRSQFQPPVELAGWNRTDLHELKLGVYPAWFQHATPAVVTACQAMLSHFVQAGAVVQEVEIHELDAMRIAHVVALLSETNANMQDYREQRRKLSAPSRVTLDLAYAFTATDYVQAQRIRTRAISEFERVFEQVDVLISPTTAIAAPIIPLGGERGGWSDLNVTTEKMRYAFPANLVGLPAISFPVGYDDAGLPIGMQAMGRWWQEQVVLRVARTAELGLERRLPRTRFPSLG